MKKYKLFVLFTMLMVTLHMDAQMKFPGGVPSYRTPNPNAYVDVQSPTVTSLGKYAEENVSYFTGSPNIDIPLYTLDVRDIKMPISLSYDSKGIMPNSLPSWVGQNWTLNIGGVISRTVKGRYDEWIYPYQTERLFFVKPKNYFQCHNKLNEFIAEGGSYSKLKENLVQGEYDLSPDEFTFNFMGKTGKFFLDQDGSWRVMSNDNLEVMFDYNDPKNYIEPLFKRYPSKSAVDPFQSKTIAGFVIRDDEGNTYTFGYNRDAIEYCTNFWNMSVNEDNETWHAACWYLTKVTDKYGNDIYKLNYERGHYIIQVFNSYYHDTVDEKASGLLSASDYFSMTNSQFPYSFSISSPVYLTSIDALNGISVILNSKDVGENLATETLYKSLYLAENGVDNLYHKLASMVNKWRIIQNGNADIKGGFYYLQNHNDSLPKFRYNSPNDFDVLSRARIRELRTIIIQCNKSKPARYIGYRFCMSDKGNRLKLDSLMIQNQAINYSSLTGIKGVYRFKYYKFDKLPNDYLTTSVDHWGYYNGRPYKKNFIYNNDMESCRNADFNYAQIGILNEIVYPTGGITDFEYEPNDYSVVLSNDRQTIKKKYGVGGGLRIKSIKTYNSESKEELLHQKDYSYLDPSTHESSGELFAAPLYYWNWDLKCENKNASYRLTTFHTSSIVPLANSSGVNLGYSFVTESIKDACNSDKVIEKHIYHYSNISEPSIRDQRFSLTFGNANQFTPFDEFSEVGFKKGLLLWEEVYNEKDELKKKNVYTYRTDNYLNKYVLTSNLTYECYGNSAQYYHYLGGIYKLYYPKYDLIGETVYDYSNVNSTPITTSHTYNKQDITFTSYRPYKHEVDFRIINSDTVSRGVFSEINSYIFGCFDSKTGNDSILYKAMSYIKPYKTKFQRNGKFIYEDDVCFYDYNVNGKKILLPKFITRKNSYNIIDTLLTFQQYSNTGMPLEFKEKGHPSTFLKWAYNDCYLVMSGNTYIPISISEKEFFDKEYCISYMNSFIKEYTTGQITGYVWDPLFGPAAIIKPNGNVLTYKYNDYGQLINIYDHNKMLLNEYEYNYRK